jgi:hypothetical protein
LARLNERGAGLQLSGDGGRVYREQRRATAGQPLGPSRSRIVLVIYSVAICFCAMALLVAASRNVSLGFVLIGLEFVVIFSIRRMGLHADARRISQEQRKSVREFILSKTANGRT